MTAEQSQSTQLCPILKLVTSARNKTVIWEHSHILLKVPNHLLQCSRLHFCIFVIIIVLTWKWYTTEAKKHNTNTFCDLKRVQHLLSIFNLDSINSVTIVAFKIIILIVEDYLPNDLNSDIMSCTFLFAFISFIVFRHILSSV